MDAGRLRHRVELQENNYSQDQTTGELTDKWEKVASLWCAIEPFSARDLIAAQGVQSAAMARIVMRYRTDITPAQRIKHKDTIYRIEGILPDKDSGLEYLTVTVSSGLSSGT